MSRVDDPIGALRRRVTLEAPLDTADAAGGAALSYTAQASVWAEIRSPSARERVDADALTSAVSHVLVIRHRSDVGPGWRVAFDNRLLRVRHVRDVDGGRTRLQLDCEEEVRA